MAGDVDHYVTDPQLLFTVAIDPTQPSPDPRHEFLGLERLDHIVVGACLEAGHDVVRVGPGSEHDDRDAGFGA